MATTQKNFQLSVDFFDRPDICAVTVEHGIKGQAATIMLLCAIYKNGYFIEWKPENYLVLRQDGFRCASGAHQQRDSTAVFGVTRE